MIHLDLQGLAISQFLQAGNEKCFSAVDDLVVVIKGCIYTAE